MPMDSRWLQMRARAIRRTGRGIRNIRSVPRTRWDRAATGKPVHILDLDGGDAKFARFHAAMRDAGITRPFAGRIESWRYDPLDDTMRAGAELRALVLARLSERRAG